MQCLKKKTILSLVKAIVMVYGVWCSQLQVAGLSLESLKSSPHIDAILRIYPLPTCVFLVTPESFKVSLSFLLPS
jgi:hypothetical protein